MVGCVFFRPAAASAGLKQGRSIEHRESERARTGRVFRRHFADSFVDSSRLVALRHRGPGRLRKGREGGGEGQAGAKAILAMAGVFLERNERCLQITMNCNLLNIL